jgi:Protein of unknown function (DUF1565)
VVKPKDVFDTYGGRVDDVPGKCARLTVRPTGAAFLIVLVAIASACTRDLYVDAGAPAGGDGTKAKPFKTIREGVTTARDRTTVHVAQGTYVEDLNTTIAHRRVRIKGSTILPVGPDNLPTGVPQSAALVKPRTPILSGTGDALLKIKARDVTIEGLQIDGDVGPADPTGILISIDGSSVPADGFSIEKNVLVNAAIGVATRMAAGKIRGNFLWHLRSQGLHICGWPAESASPRRRILIASNRMTENYINGALLFGGVGSDRNPTFPGRDGALRVEISGNEFHCNGDPAAFPGNSPNTGLYFLVNDSTVSDPMKAARIDAHVHDNIFKENIWYGVAVGQRIEPNETSIGYVFEATLKRNRYDANGLNAGIFDFRHIVVSHGGGTQPFKFGHDSTYTIKAQQDPFVSIDFDYDNPVHDSSGAELHNKLIFNGAAVPNSGDGHPHIKQGPPPAGPCAPKT